MGRIALDELDELLGICLPSLRPQTYIETGAHKGDRLLEVQSRFEAVVGVELDFVYAAHAKARVRYFPHVRVLFGDSREILPKLLRLQRGAPVFVHLDAHYCEADPPLENRGTFPLWSELQAVSSYPGAVVLSVDDVHTFGRPRPELRAGDGAEWEAVTAAAIRSFFEPARVYASKEIADELVLFLGHSTRV